METILATTRAIHFGSTLLVFGELVFTTFVARSASCAQVRVHDTKVDSTMRAVLAWCLALSVVSGALWLVLEVPLMSGEPLAEAFTGPTLGVVVRKTWFGRVWMARAVLALALGVWLACGARRTSLWLALAIAGAYVALPALAGHAARGQGAERYLRLGADMLHLLAAGAWVGALPALARLLVTARRSAERAWLELAGHATRRFSALGTLSVTALIGSGTVSAFYLVGSLAALTASDYGRLLVAKLVLVTAMLAIAGVNRWWLSPRLREGDAVAVQALARNAVLEALVAVGVVAIVGVLGITVPGMHTEHHELHSGTSRAIILNSPASAPSWPNPTSSTSRFRKANTTISKRSSAPMPSRRTAWIWRCSTDFSPPSSAVRR